MSRLWPIILFITISQSAFAKDVWVLVGFAPGPHAQCESFYTWYTDTVFHNLSSKEAKVAVVGQGAGPLINPVSFSIPASDEVSLSSQIGAFPPSGLNIVHFDISDDVFVESRLEYRFDQPCVGAPPAPGPAGKIAFPAFSRLAATREPQIHFGTDLGLQRVRTNVGIYNAGSVPANAHVELRKSVCFPVTVASADASIPPNTLVQISLTQERCDEVVPASVPPWVKHTVIVVDQPSLTYVTPVVNFQAPSISFTVGTPQ